MDSNIFYEISVLAAEIIVFGVVYRFYKVNADNFNSLKRTQCFEINEELENNIKKNNGVIEYAVISGNVRALSTPLRSQYLPYLQGVIREKITKEHRAKWSPYLRLWNSIQNNLQHTTNFTPFALCQKTSGFFEKQISIEVIDPLSAQELILPTVYDEFVPHEETLSDAIFGFFRGERLIGHQEIEKMLCEGEILTAVGRLVLDKNKLKIKPPIDEKPYILTTLTLESLLSQFKAAKNTYKILSILLGAVTLVTIIYISRHPISEIKKRIRRNQERKKIDLERKLRRLAQQSPNVQDINVPKCVVCLDKPVEVLLLECGHACLCYSCSEHVQNFCPICRNPIERTVAAFWP